MEVFAAVLNGSCIFTLLIRYNYIEVVGLLFLAEHICDNKMKVAVFHTHRWITKLGPIFMSRSLPQFTQSQGTRHIEMPDTGS